MEASKPSKAKKAAKLSVVVPLKVATTAIKIPFMILKVIKLAILFIILFVLIVGYSAYKTADGFRNGNVETSEYLDIDAGNDTGSFWVSITNDGYLALEVDIEFQLAIPEVQIGEWSPAAYTVKETVTFKIGGGETVNKTVKFNHAAIAKLEHDDVLEYTPVVTSSKYAWILPSLDKKFAMDPQTITVVRSNAEPWIKDFSTDHDTLLVETQTGISVDAEDGDADTLTYTYYEGYKGNWKQLTNDTASFYWTAPSQGGTYTLKVDVSDGKDISTDTLDITVQGRPAFVILAEPDYDEGVWKIDISSSAAMTSGPWVNATHEDSLESTSIDILKGSGNTWTGEHNITDPGTYSISAEGIDINGTWGGDIAYATWETITTQANVPKTVEAEEITLDITTSQDVTEASLTITEFEENPLEEEGLSSVGRFVSIEPADELADNLSYVNISITYSDDDIPAGLAEEMFKIYLLNTTTDEWEALEETHVVPEENYAWANISHFSTYAIFGNNFAPTVEAGDNMKVDVDKKLTFSGQASDIDGSIVLYEWDFNGDGVYDFNSTTTGVTEYTYTSDGTFTATFRVTDDDGAMGYDSITVKVRKEKDDGLWDKMEKLPSPGAFASILAIVASAVLFASHKRRS